VLVEVLPRVRDIRRLGAASVDLCAVACGRVDGFYERGLSPWDYAAGALIAAEAGAVVSDLDGAEASGRFCLAATPELHAELVELLGRAGARDA
jgi:myo-inositol-1(or 4)-monophosphatase